MEPYIKRAQDKVLPARNFLLKPALSKHIQHMDIELELNKLLDKKVLWQKTTGESLDVDYALLLPLEVANLLFETLEEVISYENPENTKVKIFGKWYNIPRQQAAFGDNGTYYKFSGTTVAAKPWLPVLFAVKKLLCKITGYDFNFVLVNRYRNGYDHIGEHRDNEPDLDPDAPIASLSLGQYRQFVLKHGDARKRGSEKQNIAPVKILLKHGSLLLMNPPTNKVWYHSLPPKKSATEVRINLTFRCIKNKK